MIDLKDCAKYAHKASSKKQKLSKGIEVTKSEYS